VNPFPGVKEIGTPIIETSGRQVSRPTISAGKSPKSRIT
jgi:hypothetical protein